LAVFEFPFKRALCAVALLSFMCRSTEEGLFSRPEQVADYRGRVEQHEAEHGAAA